MSDQRIFVPTTVEHLATFETAFSQRGIPQDAVGILARVQLGLWLRQLLNGGAPPDVLCEYVTTVVKLFTVASEDEQRALLAALIREVRDRIPTKGGAA